MKKQFLIQKSCSEKKRPAYSHLLDSYLEDLIIEQILIPHKIILGSKWTIWLSMMLLKKGKFGPQGVYVFNKPTTVSAEQVKFYPIQIPYEDIYKSKAIVKNLVTLYLQAFEQFFTLNYKKVKSADFIKLADEIDWSYINSLPYPVDITEQNYI